MFSSLRYQLLLLSLLPPIIIALALGGYLSYSRILDLEDFSEARGQAVIRQLDIAANYAAKIQDTKLLQAITNASLEEKGLRSISIFDQSRNLIVHSGPTLKNIIPSNEFLNKQSTNIVKNNIITIIEPHQKKSFTTDVQTVGSTNTDIKTDTNNNSNSVIGWIVVEYNQDIFIIKRYEAYLAQNSILFISLLIAGLLGLRLGQRFIIDIGAINNNIKRIKEGDTATPITIKSCKEFSDLANNLEDMATIINTEFDELHQNIELTTSDLKETIETIEIQNIELNLAQKEALTASKIKSEFLANTSHEIRTPLNGILGFTKILKRTPLNPEQNEYLNTIQQSSETLLAIINDILDFSKIEAGKLELEEAPFNLRQILEETVNLFAPAAYEKNIEVVLLVYQDVPLNLAGDYMRIKQVVSNLLSNAIKFTSSGTISIRVALENLVDNTIYLSISVSDTGMGMTAQQQKELFQAFSQANSSISREYGGTGLGLAISRKLVELMQGDIKVESTLNEGSTFTFTIKSRVVNKQDTSSYKHMDGKSILVIEQHQLLNSTIKHMLKSWGIFALTATSLEEASSLLEHHQVDTIVYGISPSDSLETCLFQAEKIAQQLNHPLLLLTPYNSEKINSLSIISCYKPVTEPRLYSALFDLFYPNKLSTTKTSTIKILSETNIHALVVDDQPTNLKLLNVLLGDLGITVSCAINGKEAVEISKDKQFTIIFMDIQMPVMNGYQATKLIREEAGINQQTPIIAITAHAMADEKEALFRAGINEYITKPINETQLINIIEKWCLPANHIHQGINQTQQATPIVDIQQCLKLSNNKSQLAIEMFTMLLENLTRDINDINAAFKSSDNDTLLTRVHKLHGACCYTGVPILKNIIKEFEQSIKLEQIEQYPELLQRLEKASQDLLEWHKQNDFGQLF